MRAISLIQPWASLWLMGPKVHVERAISEQLREGRHEVDVNGAVRGRDRDEYLRFTHHVPQSSHILTRCHCPHIHAVNLYLCS